MTGILILLGIAAAGAAVWHVKGNAPWERRIDPGPPIPGRRETPIPIFAGAPDFQPAEHPLDMADEYIAAIEETNRAADPRFAFLPVREKRPWVCEAGGEVPDFAWIGGPEPTVPNLAILPVDPRVAPLPGRAKRPWVCGAAPDVPNLAILPVDPVVDEAFRILPMPDPIAEGVAGSVAAPPPPPIVAASPPPISELETDIRCRSEGCRPFYAVRPEDAVVPPIFRFLPVHSPEPKPPSPVTALPAEPPPPPTAPEQVGNGLVPPVSIPDEPQLRESVIPPMSLAERATRLRAGQVRDEVNRLVNEQWRKDDLALAETIQGGGDPRALLEQLIFRILDGARAIGGVTLREQSMRQAQITNMRNMGLAELQRELIENIRPSARRQAIAQAIKHTGLKLPSPVKIPKGYQIPRRGVSRRRRGDLTLEQAYATRERLLQDRRLDNQRVRDPRTINALTTFIFRERGRRGLPRDPNPMPFVRG